MRDIIEFIIVILTIILLTAMAYDHGCKVKEKETLTKYGLINESGDIEDGFKSAKEISE